MDARCPIIEHSRPQLIFFDAIINRKNAVMQGLVFEFEHRVHRLYFLLVGGLKLLTDLALQLLVGF